MTDYVFLVSLFPQLQIGHLPALGFVELKQLFKINLTAADWRKVELFLRQIDFENMRNFWAKEPFDPRGNLNREEMERALIDYTWPKGEEFPSYLIDFLNKYRSDEERLNHFQLLLSQFYDQMIEEEEGFLSAYYAFQKELRLVMLGFRAKLLGRDVAVELQYEDETDPLVAQILAQKDSKVYEPPFEYKELKPIFENYQDDPLELHKALYEYQFNHIVEFWGGDLFSIDRVLNYMARLILVERWLELDMQRGIEILDEIERKVE